MKVVHTKASKWLLAVALSTLAMPALANGGRPGVDIEVEVDEEAENERSDGAAATNNGDAYVDNTDNA